MLHTKNGENVPAVQRLTRRAIEDIRTLYRNKDPELLFILENIKKLEVKFGIQSEDDYLHAA
jgi:hypothetical protein